MLIIVTYDIEDNRKRTRLAKKLRDFGPRVQKSVFEADIDDEELKRIKTMLDEIKLKKSDSIRLYHICGECKKKIKILGAGSVTEDKKFYIV